MNAYLANMRWLCLPSENLGQDWFEKGQEIDSILTEEGYDLSEESTYLLFSEGPDKILNGDGQCLIARPVIGPKKVVSEPLKLLDWTAAPVWQETVQGETFSDVLMNSLAAKHKAVKGPKPYAESFSLRIRRSLTPALILSVEVIFHE